MSKTLQKMCTRKKLNTQQRTEQQNTPCILWACMQNWRQETNLGQAQTSASKLLEVRPEPRVSQPGLMVESRPNRWRRRRPKQKCSTMWKISTGLSLLPNSGSSSMMRSMSTLAWIKSPSVLRFTVPLIPIRQCSCIRQNTLRWRCCSRFSLQSPTKRMKKNRRSCTLLARFGQFKDTWPHIKELQICAAYSCFLLFQACFCFKLPCWFDIIL